MKFSIVKIVYKKNFLIQIEVFSKYIRIYCLIFCISIEFFLIKFKITRSTDLKW